MNEASTELEAIIQAHDVIKIYKTDGLEVVALRGLDLEVAQGELAAIMGPSGCGKTTLLNLLGGMDRPSAGSILINGLPLSDLDQDQLSDYRAAKIGFIFQFFNLIAELTAEENISIPMRITGMNRKEAEQRAEQLLDLVGLRDRRGHRPSQLSGGEQQRVAIATALANDPPLILADEPTGELDTEAGTHILDLLRKLAHEEGKTVVVVTHDTRVARYADRVLRILDGRITAEQEAGELVELGRAASEREELEKLRKRVAELTDTLTRIRQSLTKA